MIEYLWFVLDAVHSLACELDKVPPKIVIEHNGIKLPIKLHSLLNNVFMHVMRNAVDHGLEKAEQRKRSGKAEQGQITLVVSQEDDLVHFNVRDDGRGVGMDTVKGFLEQVGGGIKITLDEGDEATEFRPFSTNIWLML